MEISPTTKMLTFTTSMNGMKMAMQNDAGDKCMWVAKIG